MDRETFGNSKKHYKFLQRQFLKQKALYKTQATNSRHEEVRHITLGLALLGLDVGTSTSVRCWAFVRAGRFSI